MCALHHIIFSDEVKNLLHHLPALWTTSNHTTHHQQESKPTNTPPSLLPKKATTTTQSIDVALPISFLSLPFDNELIGSLALTTDSGRNSGVEKFGKRTNRLYFFSLRFLTPVYQDDFNAVDSPLFSCRHCQNGHSLSNHCQQKVRDSWKVNPAIGAPSVR